MALLVQNDVQGIPESPQKAVENFRESVKLFNEFREPTPAIANSSRSTPASPLTTYTIYAIIFLVIAFAYLYWKYKKE